MLRRRIYVVLSVVAILAIGAGALWVSQNTGRREPKWGRGTLREAERAYYMDRIDGIIHRWQHMARYGEREIGTGRVAKPGFTCLVIDTTALAMWIERDGRVLPEYRTELPKGMTWTLRHCGPHKNAELASPARFRVRGLFSDRQPQERIVFVGQSDRTGFLEFSFNSSDRGHGHSSGTWNPTLTWKSRSKQDNDEEPYESILVTDAEYAEAQAGFSAADVPGNPDEPAEFTENQAAWRRIEKRLYQEIERHVEAEGFELRRLEVTCGPDCSAASAELRAGRSALLRGLAGGPSSRQAYLKIDHLGDDVWYVKSAPDPRFPGAMRGRRQLDLELLVCATGDVPKPRRDELLAQGRAKQAETPRPPSKWQVVLSNGATVAFVGVCESPSGGKDWWGPGGRPLRYVPHVNYEPYGRYREDHTIYEIAWRVSRPSVAGSSTRSSLEGCVGSYGRTIQDRYGQTIYEGLEVQGYAFKTSRRKATLTMGVRVGEGDFEWVHFRNISLVRGEDSGFEVVQSDESSPPRAAD